MHGRRGPLDRVGGSPIPHACVSWAFVRVQPQPTGRDSVHCHDCASCAGEAGSHHSPATERRRPVKIPGRRGRRGYGRRAPPPSVGRRARPLYTSARLRGVPAGRSRRPHTRPYLYAACPACLRHVTWCPPAFFLPAPSATQSTIEPSQILPLNSTIQKEDSRHIKMSAHAWSTKYR
jgi:hypothetical protein